MLPRPTLQRLSEPRARQVQQNVDQLLQIHTRSFEGVGRSVEQLTSKLVKLGYPARITRAVTGVRSMPARMGERMQRVRWLLDEIDSNVPKGQAAPPEPPWAEAGPVSDDGLLRSGCRRADLLTDTTGGAPREHG